MSLSFEWRVLRVGALRECLDAWLRSPLHEALSEDFRTAAEMVMDELGSNFLRYSGPKAREMWVKIEFDGTVMTMTFADDGVLFDPGVVPEPPKGNIGLLPVGGRGIYMVRGLVHRWEYREENRRNVNVLRKFAGRDPRTPPPLPPDVATADAES